MAGTQVNFFDPNGNSRSAYGTDKYTNPDEPSYRSIHYRRTAEQLETVLDAWEGKPAWVDDPVKAARYLRRGEAESDTSYSLRLQSSLYRNTFRRTISRFAGLLTKYELSDVLPGIEEWVTDVDGKGNSLEVFLKECDIRVLRDGYVGIHVDFPVTIDPETGRQQLTRFDDITATASPRPLLRVYERVDITKASGSVVQGGYRLDNIILREVAVVPKGRFGEEERVYYKVLYPDVFYLFEEISDALGNLSYVPIIDGAPVTLGEIPFVFYNANGLDYTSCEPPFLELSHSNFSRYDLYSDYREVMRKCNLPVPVRKGHLERFEGDLPPLVLGHSTAVDVFADGDFSFAEPTGAAISATKEEIAALDASMLEDGLNFLTGESAASRTATEVELQSAQTKATLYGVAAMKESAVELIFSYWAKWLGLGDVGGRISINKDILESKIEPAAVQTLITAVTEGIISRESALRMLAARDFFPSNFDVEEEISLVPEPPLMEQKYPEPEPDDNNKDNA